MTRVTTVMTYTSIGLTVPKLIVNVFPEMTGVTPGLGEIVIERISKKAGLVSLNTTFVALIFPLFPTVIVKTTALPTVALLGELYLVTAGSAICADPMSWSPK